VALFNVTTGRDTWVSQLSPNTVNADGRYPAIKGGGTDAFYVLLFMPLSAARIAGRTILSATLSIPVQGNWVTQTVAAQAIATSWGIAGTNWNNKPGVTGATASSGSTGALAAGARFEITVTALVQAIADGQPNYGWRLTTNQSTDRSTIRGFDSGLASWTLNVEVSDAPLTPSNLSPAGVIGIAKPVLMVDESDDIAQINVQVDASASSPFDYDSGWVATTIPQLDLATVTANALPASQGNAGTFDTDITGWTGSNATLARVTTPTQAGAGALRMTASSAASMTAASSNAAADLVPVTPGQTLHVEGYSRAATATRDTQVDIQWYDSTPTLLSTSTGTASTNSTSSYGLRTVTAVAPASAVYARPRLTVTSPASGEQHYWDTVTINTGSAYYAGLADGETTNWRARVKAADGSASAWSDWAEITRHVKPSMVMDNPSGSAIWNPTPDITAHLSPAGDTDTRWQVIITAVADPTDVRYNSGDALTGATLDHRVPLRWNGRRVMYDDGTFRLVVKAWDRSDRVPSPGDTTFVRTIVTVTLDVDGTITAPNTLTATQATTGYPEVLLAWQRASDPSWFTIRRDGVHLATVDVDDYRTSAGHWAWVDWTAEPNVTHTYYVRAVTDVSGVKKQSVNSNSATTATTVKSVWLRSDFGDVELFGSSVSAAQVDKRQTFEMPYRSENVDIVTAIGGMEGSASLCIDNRPGATSVDTVRTILENLRQAPETDVRMVWATQNRWVHLRGLSVVPAEDIVPARNRKHEVTFGFFEIDEPD